MAIQHLEPREAHEVLKNSPRAVYLDVRTAEEYAAGHVEGAAHVPVVFMPAPGQMVPNEEFVERVAEMFDPDIVLVVGCQSGGRSQKACELLEQAGFKNLVNVRGGFGGARDPEGKIVVTGWRDAGLPVCSNPSGCECVSVAQQTGRSGAANS